MNYPRTLRDARTRAGLTQAQLASFAGTSQTAISAYENGARSPSLETFARLLSASGSRLEVTRGNRVRTPSAAEHAATALTLSEVLDLAETLPTRHAKKLVYPRLSEEA